MSLTAVVTQSNYIPWKGYFDLMRRADVFITLDCVQFTRRDWRNRNRVKTPAGVGWLTIPVELKGRFDQAIDETRIASHDWVQRHLSTIRGSYARAKAFDPEFGWLADRMREVGERELLSEVNHRLLEAIRDRIGLATPIVRCDELLPRDALVRMGPTERLDALCRSVSATRYLTGPAARSYLDLAVFDASGIDVEWMDYTKYPTYPQLWGEFEHGVSIVDLLMNVGHQNAMKFATTSPDGPSA